VDVAHPLPRAQHERILADIRIQHTAVITVLVTRRLGRQDALGAKAGAAHGSPRHTDPLCMADYKARFGVFEQAGEFSLGIRWVEWHRNRADLPTRNYRNRELRYVLHDNGDTISASYAALQHMARQLIAYGVQLAIVEYAIKKAQCRSAGTVARSVGKHRKAVFESRPQGVRRTAVKSEPRLRGRFADGTCLPFVSAIRNYDCGMIGNSTYEAWSPPCSISIVGEGD